MGETGTGSNDNDWGKIIRFLQVEVSPGVLGNNLVQMLCNVGNRVCVMSIFREKIASDLHPSDASGKKFCRNSHFTPVIGN